MSTSDRQESKPPGRLRRAARWTAGLLMAHGHHLLPAAAAIITLSSTYLILGPVLNRSGDNMYHLLNEWALVHAFAVGDDPFGPLGLEFGQPILRFYQCLFYLVNALLHGLTTLDIRFLHNLTIVVCFALSPFSYAYFLRKLGLNRWAAGLGGMLSMISIAAFGNSFEAYHQAGIVTQSIGGLFFPWFMGAFIGMLRGENSPVTPAFLFAVAFLSHAIMSVFTVFAGALYFLVADVGLRRNWKRLGTFSLIGAALVAFWVLPFVAHTREMRPVPDSIIRGRGVVWFTSASRSELAMILSTGRLLDDGKALGDDRVPEDRFIDRINIIGTLKPRPSVLTALTALGCLLALPLLRRNSVRYLLAGLAFSLMLFAGPDDFGFLRYLPFIEHIQTFRCTYLVEFFAFGLAAFGSEAVLRFLLGYARTRRAFLRRPLTAAWILLAGLGLSWVGAEIYALGQKHLVVRSPRRLNEMVDAMAPLPDRGYPYRVDVQFKGRHKLRHGWLRFYGYQPKCTHWKGTGPSSAYHLCRTLGSATRNPNLYALAGIRWISGQEDEVERLVEHTDDDGDPLLDRWPNGKDRRGRDNDWHYLLDTGRDHFLRPLVGKPLPVVCTHKQWIWINRSWTHRYRGKLWAEETPIAMRVPAGELGESGLLDSAPTVFYFDASRLEEDREALETYEAEGGKVVASTELEGIEATVLEQEPIWKALPAEMRRLRSNRPSELEREELDPGLAVTRIERSQPLGRSHQYFEFWVDALEPVVAVLPAERVPGWRAELDGEPLPVFSTGPDLCGVLLPAGAHRLVFHWEMPAWQRAMQLVSLGGLVFVLGVWGMGAARRLRPRRRS
jgi:hypothetical protein